MPPAKEAYTAVLSNPISTNESPSTNNWLEIAPALGSTNWGRKERKKKADLGFKTSAIAPC
ncbi:MAG: hypothetical protein WBG63_18870, partial [Phormidesmis sp.]